MIEFQQKLLGDHGRNEAFYRALKKIIKKGETVVADLGSGTGLLSFLAARLGAKACYLYESSPEMLDLSRLLARENGIRNCHFIAGHSSAVKNPVKADLVISETLGNFALEENILETLWDGRRFLKPGGIMIPARLEQFVAPVASPRIFEEINVWDRIGFGLKFEAAKKEALNNMYVYKVRGDELLASAPAKLFMRPKDATIQKWDEVWFGRDSSSIRRRTCAWSKVSAAMLYGFCLWWECELIPGVHISTSPFSAATHWDQIFLPLLHPIKLAAGDRLEVTLKLDSQLHVGIRLQWEVRVFGEAQKKEKIRMSLDTAW